MADKAQVSLAGYAPPMAQLLSEHPSMFHDARGAYTALELEDVGDRERQVRRAPPTNSAPVRWLITACLVSLVVSALNLAATTLWGPPPAPPPAPRFPSAYIGLERVNASQRILDLAPVPNYPLVIAALDRRAPGAVGRNGSVFHVDEHRSTVMQFRVHDFGLERCTLDVSVPAPAEMGRKTYHAAGIPQHIDVWKLELADTNAALCPRTSSWNTRPARVALLGTLAFAPGAASAAPWFACAAGSLLTFEFACPGEGGCGVRFEQDRAAPLLGVRMYQRHG